MTTATNEVRTSPPSGANASKGLSTCVYASLPQGKPPKGTRERSSSKVTQSRAPTSASPQMLWAQAQVRIADSARPHRAMKNACAPASATQAMTVLSVAICIQEMFGMKNAIAHTAAYPAARPG